MTFYAGQDKHKMLDKLFRHIGRVVFPGRKQIDIKRKQHRLESEFWQYVYI